MTTDREKSESNPMTHGNSGEGTASIVPHLPAANTQQQQQSQLPKFEDSGGDKNSGGGRV